MGKWHYAKDLRGLARETLGHTAEQAEVHMALEPLVDRLWSLGDRDFAWYDTPMYAYSCVECFLDFTKQGAGGFGEWLREHAGEHGVTTCIDFCCGIGASTRYMAELAPDVSFIAHNFPGSGAQSRVADALLEDAGKSVLELGLAHNYPPYQAVAAFELLEHIERPLLAVDMWSEHGARVIGEVSSFHIDNYGHFPEYDMDGVTVPRDQAARLFTKLMKKRGWDVVYSGWNGKPRVWAR